MASKPRYVCAPAIIRCICAGSVYLGRSRHSQHHAGGVARPRYTESVTFGCGWPPFPSTCFCGIVYVRTGEAQFGGVPHVPVEPPRCQHATPWSGTRPNDMYAFVWAILLRSASPAASHNEMQPAHINLLFCCAFYGVMFFFVREIANPCQDIFRRSPVAEGM